MTIHVDYLQAGTYTAADDRYAEGTGLTSAGGVSWRSGVLLGDGTELKVTAQGTPDMTVKVATGQGVVPCSGDATAAPYITTNDASANVTIATSDPTHARKDLICLTVRDSFYSGSNDDAILQVITGTPAASPSLPATPSNSIALAEVDVAANATSISSGSIIDLRTYTVSRGGIIPCTSSTRPSVQYAGLTIFETDTKLFQTWDGSAWRPQRPGGPLGIVGSASGPSSQTDYASVGTPVTVTVNVVSGRTYRVTGTVFGSQITASGVITVNLTGCTLPGNVRPVTGVTYPTSTAAAGTGTGFYVATATGTATFTITAQDSAGSYRIAANAAVIVVEDIGT